MTPVKKIARALGVTEAGLRQLAHAANAENGISLQSGRGGSASGGARERLIRDGHLEFREVAISHVKTRYPYITETGRAIVRRAADMGFKHDNAE